MNAYQSHSKQKKRLLRTRVDQIMGCLCGGALGDAIGAQYESDSKKVDSLLPPQLFVTDDTQLTIATCESIIESHGISPASIADHFVRWFRARRISGIGSSTLKALRDLDAGVHWALSGAVGERSAGNGAAMRIAPLALFLDPRRDEDRQIIREVCRITHRNDEAYIGALAVQIVIRYGLEHNLMSRDLLTHIIQLLPDSRTRDRIETVYNQNMSAGEYVANFSASGYVVDSVPLAITAAIEATGFLTTVQKLCEFGGDTDTNASNFGSIFGAFYGMQKLPEQLLDRIVEADLIRSTAAKLAWIQCGPFE